MKNEEFFQMLNGMEDKYIEKASELLALQQEAREGMIVRAAPKSRRSMWKTVIVSAAATAAAVFGAVFLMRNVGKNVIMFEPANSFDSSVQDENIGSGDSELENSESSSVQSGDSEESAPPTESGSSVFEENSTSSSAEDTTLPTESDGEEVTSNGSDVSEPDDVMAIHPAVEIVVEIVDMGTVYHVVDPVDDSVRREADFSDTTITLRWIRKEGFNLYEDYDPTIEGSEVSLGYLKDFFGTDALPFDDRYKGNLERVAFNAAYNCRVSEGAKAYTPVNGKVVAVNDDNMYHNGWGNAVAIEFEDKVFAIAHLDEVNVKVGDIVTAGQAVGICGMSGDVYVGDGPTFSMVIMVKVPDPDF